MGTCAVHFAVDDGVPVIPHVAGQFIADAGHVQRDGAGQDEQPPVVVHPQIVNDRRHQAQHAARLLEALDGRPVLIEAVEDLRVDGIAGAQALHVLHFPRLGGEIGGGFPDTCG